MTLEQSLARLYARVPLGMRLGLEPMREACKTAGHPERAFQVVHVAGTNGKGSVCAMVESIARTAGLRTGLFTSPHLARFAERIRLAGEPVGDDALAALLERVLAMAPALSFFETATLAAFVAFAEAKVDVAILEVGIGGRLDATNVVPAPRAAAITRIALDHMDRLGSTVEAIAREKAGIAKPGLDLVLGRVTPDVRRVIDEVARAAGATTSLAEDDHAAASLVARASLGLAGEHQRDNAHVACVVARRMGASEEATLAGLERVRWPGRLEEIASPGGPVLLDCAHNPDGAQALAKYLKDSGASRRVLVFGALADKAWTEMLDVLVPFCEARVYVEPPNCDKGARAAASPARMSERHPGETARDVAHALARARELAGPGGTVVVAGSIFLVGDARAILLSLPRDPAVAL